MIKFREFKIESRSNLFEYLVYFAIILLINTVLMGVILYGYFSRTMVNKAIKENNNILEQLKNAQEVTLKEVDKSFTSIFLDQRYIEFMEYYNKRDYLTLQQLQYNLSNLVFSNDYIDSVAIFYQKEGVVLSSNTAIETIENYYDGTFLEQLKSTDIKNGFVKSRETNIYSTLEPLSVISFIKPLPILYNDRPSAYVVINFRASYLQNMIDSIKTETNSYIVITDSDGRIISQNPKRTVFEQKLTTNKQNKDSVISNGFFYQDINGEQSLISYVFSQNYGWWYYYIVPLSSITSSIRFIGVITLLVSLFSILLCLLVSFLLSKRIYSPIQEILKLLTGGTGQYNEEGEEPDREREVLAITKKVRKIVDRNKNLEALLEEYEVYQRSTFLAGLLCGTVECNDKIADKLEYYKISLDTMGIFAVAIISIDNYSDFINEYSEKQKNMLYIYIRENISNEIFSKCKGFIAETGINEIAIVMNFQLSADKQEAKDIVDMLSDEIHSLLDSNFKYTFTLGVSGLHTGIESIPECYGEASAAVNYRFLFGYNNVILYEHVKVYGDGKYLYPFPLEKKILNSLKIGDRSGVSDSMKEFADYITEHLSGDIEFSRYYFLQLTAATYKCIYEMGRNFEAVFNMQKEVYSEILREDTMSGMVNKIQQIYTTVLDYSDKIKDNKNAEIISAVLEYITVNLGSNISVEGIARHFHISTAHLRKIFKIYTGQSIKGYIDSERIKQAKRLLENPDITIGDVAERVGYTSSQTFIRAFKTSVGLTPGEYRSKSGRTGGIPKNE